MKIRDIKSGCFYLATTKYGSDGEPWKGTVRVISVSSGCVEAKCDDGEEGSFHPSEIIKRVNAPSFEMVCPHCFEKVKVSVS